MNFPRARVHQQHGRTMEERLTRLEDMLARYLQITLGSSREDARSSWKGSSVPHPIKTPRVGSSANSKSEVRKSEKGVPKQDGKVVVCPKCNGFGHLLKECSNKHAFTIEEWKEIRSKSPRKSWVVETENGVEELPEDEEEKRGEPTPPEIQKVVVDAEKLESIQRTPKEDVIHPKVRKFEAFETLFDPPKFLPEFMKRDIIDTVEATVILARASVNGVEDTIFEGGEDVGSIDVVVPQGVCPVNGLGSFVFFGFDLNKIRGRIFLKKGRMNQAWVHVVLLLSRCDLSSVFGHLFVNFKSSVLMRIMGTIDQRKDQIACSLSVLVVWLTWLDE